MRPVCSPSVSQGVAEAGLCGTAGQADVTLNLDADVLSQVFTCQITSYNNATIKALNPGIE